MFERWAARLVGAASIAAVLAVWEAGGRAGIVNPILAPRPSLILDTLRDLVESGEVLAPLGRTLALFGLGYGIACVVGIGLGLLMGTSRRAYGLLEPLVELVRPMPKPALVPALFLFLGIGWTTMVTVVVLAATFPVLIATLGGVRGLDPTLLDTARTFRIPRWRTITGVVLPGALPSILSGMRTALGLGLVLAILAEMLAGESGLGFLILDLQRSFQIRAMFAWIFVLAALGFGLTLAFDLADRRLVPWRGRT